MLFRYRLAKELGMSVARLNDEISNDEMNHWQAYDRIDPFGSWRGDVQAGIIASVIVNALRGKNGQVAKPTDFVLKFTNPGAVDPQENARRIARKLGIPFGAKKDGDSDRPDVRGSTG